MDVGTGVGDYKWSVFEAKIMTILKATELINDEVVESNNRVPIYVNSQAQLKVIGIHRTRIGPNRPELQSGQNWTLKKQNLE